jgi:hypothetical protein
MGGKVEIGTYTIKTQWKVCHFSLGPVLNLSIYLFCLGAEDSGDGTQGLVHAKQVSYH